MNHYLCPILKYTTKSDGHNFTFCFIPNCAEFLRVKFSFASTLSSKESKSDATNIKNTKNKEAFKISHKSDLNKNSKLSNFDSQIVLIFEYICSLYLTVLNS